MPTFRLIGQGMADRADTARACPLSPSKQAIPLGDRRMRLRSLCAMII